MATSLKIKGYSSEKKTLLWEVDFVNWWDTDEILEQFPCEINVEPSYTDYHITIDKKDALSLHERYRNRAFKWWQDSVKTLDENLNKQLPDKGKVELYIYEWESGL